MLPRTDWSFYLLSAVNAGIGLVGVWFLAGRFLKDLPRLAAVIFLIFLPSYTVMATNFNANTILLSLWPWTIYFFVRSIENAGKAGAVTFGIFAAAALLSKYFSALLI